MKANVKYCLCCFVLCFPTGFLYSFDEPLSKSFQSPVLSIATGIDNNLIFASSGNSIYVLDEQLRQKKRIKSELDFVCDVVVNDNQLIIAGGSPSEHGMIEIYLYDKSNSDWVFSKRKLVHNDVIHSITVTKEHLITASADSKINVLSRDDFKILRTMAKHSKRVVVAKPIPSTDLMISGGLDDTLRVWSLRSGKTERVMTNHQDDVLDIKPFVPPPDDSSFRIPLVATASKDKTVRFWQPTIGRLVRFKKFDQMPTASCWIPGTNNILVGFEDGRVVSLSSQTLKVTEIANVKRRVFSLAMLGISKVLIGAQDRLVLDTIKAFE